MRRSLCLSILAISVALLPDGRIWGAVFEPQGFVDTYQAVRLADAGDFISSWTRLRFGGWVNAEAASLFFAFNAIQNNVIPANTGFELREAYMDYQAEAWDLRVGRQIIVWGKADGLAITDVVSPWDYTEFLARDFDDIRMPVDAVRGRLLFDNINIELVWLPKFVPAILPPDGSPWAYTPKNPDEWSVDYVAPDIPAFTSGNSEIGARLSIYTSAVDAAVSCFRGWEDLPTLHRTVDTSGGTTEIHYYPEHHRLMFVGIEFSKPLGNFVIRGEAAFYMDKYFEPADQLSVEIFQRNALHGMIGSDWSPGNDWAITAQLADAFILNYGNAIKNDEHTILGTMRVSKKLLRQTLELSVMSYFGINGKDGFIRSQAGYAVTDEFQVIGGVDVFYGEDGMLGQYDHNDEFWMKAKYSF